MAALFVARAEGRGPDASDGDGGCEGHGGAEWMDMPGGCDLTDWPYPFHGPGEAVLGIECSHIFEDDACWAEFAGRSPDLDAFAERAAIRERYGGQSHQKA